MMMDALNPQYSINSINEPLNRNLYAVIEPLIKSYLFCRENALRALQAGEGVQSPT